MIQKVKVDLGPIQETLLITLLGRAEETKKKKGLLSDPKAVEIVNSIDYDFSKWKGKRSLIGTSVRTCIYDDLVKDFLKNNPTGTVVEIGSGLNTRYERLDNGLAHWIELDLPDSMSLRKKFFKDSERREMIAGSFLETNWFEKVLAAPAPYCFVSEGVIIYLDHEDIEKSIRHLVKTFPGNTLIMDTCSAKMVETQGKQDVMKTMPKDSWFRWKCDDPKSIEPWGLQWKKSLGFADIPKEHYANLPWAWRLMLRFTPWVLKKMAHGYNINLYKMN